MIVILPFTVMVMISAVQVTNHITTMVTRVVIVMVVITFNIDAVIMIRLVPVDVASSFGTSLRSATDLYNGHPVPISLIIMDVALSFETCPRSATDLYYRHPGAAAQAS